MYGLVVPAFDNIGMDTGCNFCIHFLVLWLWRWCEKQVIEPGHLYLCE